MDRSQNQDKTTQDTRPESGSFFDSIRNAAETRISKLTVSVAILIGTATLSACASDRGVAVETPGEPGIIEPMPETTETAKPVIDNKELIGGVLEQTVPFEKMNTISVVDYAKLAFPDRFAFGFDTVINSYPSITNGADPIHTNPELIPGFFWQPALNLSLNSKDADTRAKLAGSYRYYTTTKSDGEISPSYQSTIDSVVQNGGEGIGGNYSYSVTDHGELQHGQDRDGKPIDFMNFTYQGGSGDDFETAPETTAQGIRTEIKMLNGQTVIFYALGYGIDGHQSPVETYPY